MYCLQWLIPVLLMPKPSNPALVQTHVMFMVLYLIGFFLEKKPCTICSLVFLATVFLICYSGLAYNECAKILVVMPTPSISHQIVYQPLWEKLLSRGHEITLLTTDPIKNSNYSNLKQIDWSFVYNLQHNTHNFSRIIMNCRIDNLKRFMQYTDLMHETMIQELEYEDVKKLVNDKNEYFDIALIEYLHPTMLAFSERFSCPYIGVSPMDITIFGHEAIGNPTNPAVYTDMLVPYVPKMNYLERLLNTLHYIAVSFYFYCYMSPKEDALVKQYFGANISKLAEIQRKVSMVFLNTHPVLHDVRPLIPNVIQLGGAIHLHELQPLPEELELLLNGSENGAVYFSLGSNVEVNDLPSGTFDVLVDTFTHLPLKVMWKTDSDLFSNLSNVYSGNWLPQQEILAHKNIKAFITVGDQQSLEEAIHYGVPIIGLPFCADQIANIKRLSRKGVCIALNIEDMKKEQLENAIYEITRNKSYLNSVQKLSVLLRETPMLNLDKAVWWTEYVIKHKGATILKSDVPNIPLYQYFLLDIFAAFLLILIIILYIEYRIVKCIIKFMRSRTRQDKFHKIE